MEFLNEKATIVFGEILNRMHSGHLKIVNDPFMLLEIKLIDVHIQTPWGRSVLYSLCHYVEQNGDLIKDPEMCFIITDERRGFLADFGKLKIAPYMFWQATTGVCERSVKIDDKRLKGFNRAVQGRHTHFANEWLENIRAQGFLNQ